MKDSHELARLATLDAGVTVTPEDVRTWAMTGKGLERFTEEQRHEVWTSIVKEMATP